MFLIDLKTDEPRYLQRSSDSNNMITIKKELSSQSYYFEIKEKKFNKSIKLHRINALRDALIDA